MASGHRRRGRQIHIHVWYRKIASFRLVTKSKLKSKSESSRCFEQLYATDYYYYYFFDPGTQFPRKEKITLCNIKKYKNQAGMSLTPPPPSQNSHAVRWHYYYYYYTKRLRWRNVKDFEDTLQKRITKKRCNPAAAVAAVGYPVRLPHDIPSDSATARNN